MIQSEPTLRSVALPLVAMLAVQTAVAMAVYVAPVMAPVAAPEIGVASSAIGYFIAIVYLGSMIGSVTAGGWIARFGPIRASQAGLVLCFVGLALGATAWLPLVLLGAFTIGLGYGPATPASSQILVRAAPASLISLTFSIKQTGVPLGGVLAGVAVPTMILLLGWSGAALAVGVACLALVFGVAPIRARYDCDLDTRAPITLRSTLGPLRLVLGVPRLAEMAFASFVYAGVQITLVTYLVTFLTEMFSMSLVLAGLVMAVSQVASVFGRVLWGTCADRIVSPRRMLALLGLAMGGCAAATLAASPDWPIALLFVFAAAFGATAVGWNGVLLAEVARCAPVGQAGPATGGVLFFTYLGVVVTPPLFNVVLGLAGSYAVAYGVFALPALAVGMRLLMWRPPLHPAA
ncbi:MAG: MFS transporter [Betaproteobacteria bacterium]|nr:MFS transporter [Betaproteobacteria bacterium]